MKRCKSVFGISWKRFCVSSLRRNVFLVGWDLAVMFDSK